MKDKFNIDHIRCLLHSYYEGETTPEEELHLEAYFRDTPEWEIPEDLASDLRLFYSMASLHPSASDMEIPDGLYNKISEIPTNRISQNNETKQRKLASRLGYVMAAACACLILALGIKYLTASNENDTKTIEYAAESPVNQPAQPSAISSEVKTKPESLETTSIPITQTHRRNNKIAGSAVQLNRMEDGFIEITDPEEAEKIIIEIGRLLASNNQKTNEAIQHLEKTVDEHKEISKSLLQ